MSADENYLFHRRTASDQIPDWFVADYSRRMERSRRHTIAIAGAKDKDAFAFDVEFDLSRNDGMRLIVGVLMPRIDRTGIIGPLEDTVTLGLERSPQFRCGRRMRMVPMFDVITH